MNSSPVPLMPFRFSRDLHLAALLPLLLHRVPASVFVPAGGFNRGHAVAPPRPKRRKWKGWQQQLRENGRR